MTSSPDAGPKGRKPRSKPAAKTESEPEKPEKAPRKKSSGGSKAGKNLVIVESPAKARTINKYLGKDYDVRASMGHVRDLPKKTLGIDIDKGFEPEYHTIRGKGKTLQELRKAVKNARAVYLAPDLDREGEAIAWHLVEALDIPHDKAYRVTFNEITKNAIEKAFEHPSKIAMGRVEAQQARRILDRLVGYKLSPLLWEKVTRGLSAGRVQSVAVKLIVEREKEIQAFVPEEYWKLTAHLKKKQGEATPVEAELVRVGEEKVSLPNEASVQEVLARIADHGFAVRSVESRERVDRANPPFTTSTLQQKGSTELRFSAKKTMTLAQQLYEGVELGPEGSVALITYMRTDSVRVSEDSLVAVRGLIAGRYGEGYLPEEPNQFKGKKGAQEAHEAVRPTDPNRTPESIKPFVERDLYRLYDLIWRRFTASQMKPAVYRLTTADIAAGDAVFQAKGKVLVFDGHTVVSGSTIDENEPVLPPLVEGEGLELTEPLKPSQHHTQPPPRFSEATLVRSLEKLGIGRPSTYAPIISTVQDRGYVKLIERRFHATDLGILTTELLVQHFPEIIDVDFTRQMEEKLDHIEESDEDYRQARVHLLEQFYGPFGKELEKAKVEMEDVKSKPQESPYVCDQCEKPMVYRWNRNGRFLGCSGYPECRNVRAVDLEGKPLDEEVCEVQCDKCQAPMKVKSGRMGRFLACTAYPECRYTLSIDKEGQPIRPEATDEVCDFCGEPMVIKKGRRGPYKACSATPPYHKIDGEVCEKCGADMEVKYARRGPFLACSAFPKCRNAKDLKAGKEVGSQQAS